MSPVKRLTTYGPRPNYAISPSELARLATIPEPDACPVALELEARSAITAALQGTMPTYEDMGAHVMPASM